MRYLLTKFAAAAWVACTCMAVLGTPPEARADTTTYLYTGSPYTEIQTDIINVGNCQFPPACTFVPNPNSAADAAKFGTNMTGFATFNFDTAGVTGTFSLVPPNMSGITELQLNSGVYSVNFPSVAPTFPPGVSLTLTNGNITNWGLFTNPVSCSFSNGTNECGWTSGGPGQSGITPALPGDTLTQICPSCGDARFSARNGVPGTWVVVPAPTIGAGLPGLILAGGALLALARCRRRTV